MKKTFSDVAISKKFHTLFTAQHIGLWEYNNLTGELNFLNDYFNLLGLKQAHIEFSDMDSLKAIIHPDDLVIFNNAFTKALTGSSIAPFAYRIVSPSNEIIWLKEHLCGYSSTGSSTPDTLISYTQNITKDQEEKDFSRRERERYHTLLNAMTPNFIFIFNKDFTFHDVILPDGLKLFDEPKDLLQRSGKTLYAPEISERFITTINECLATGTLRSMEYHIDLVGNRYYYQAHIVPYEGDKAFALIQDVSDRVRRVNNLIAAREQAEEADQMKSAFLANMSHEIRTPLNAIVGFSELIAAGEVEDEEKDKFLDIIHTNNELLLKLINDILDLSRIESGKNEIVLRDTHLFSLIDEIKLVYELKIGDQINFNVLYPPTKLSIKTDPDRVKQILYNFLSNAIKNTQKGTITLGVEEVNDQLRFFVSDTGCGISQNHLNKIFNRFEKINHFVQGTGLGLSICATLARRFGGKIDVESAVNKGSTFSFYLPYQKSPQINDIPKYPNSTHTVSKRPVILIAENTEDNYTYAQQILQHDYDVIQAKNGEEAVLLYMERNPDLVLMSIQLPVMNGLESAKKIRDISSKTPIIGLTSSDFYTEQKNAMDSGYNDVLSRPYAATELKEIIIALI